MTIWKYCFDIVNQREKKLKEEQKKKEIEGVVLKTVGDDINALAQQCIAINESLLPMYEVLLEIQAALIPDDEEEDGGEGGEDVPPIEDEPTEPTEPIEDNEGTNDNVDEGENSDT